MISRPVRRSVRDLSTENWSLADSGFRSVPCRVIELIDCRQALLTSCRIAMAAGLYLDSIGGVTSVTPVSS